MNWRTNALAFTGLVAVVFLVGCGNAPAPDSWATFSINALVAVGTLGAVVVALFLDPLRAWWFPPRLILSLRDHPDLGPDRETVGGQLHETPVWWFHLLVSSGRRRLPVHGVRVMVTRVEDDTGGRLWDGQIAMVWAVYNEQARTIGAPALADLCAFYENRVTSTGERLGLLVELQPGRSTPYNFPRRVEAGKPVVLSFEAQGDETDSNVLRVRIAWDGTWGADEKEMQKHLKVEVVGAK